MSQSKTFELKIDQQQLAWLSIDVQGEKMNTLQAAFVDEMRVILAELEANKQDIKGLVIHSLKPDNFVAGADVRMLDACSSAEEATQLATIGRELFSELNGLPFSSVAAIHGPCLGGGLELALACDYRVCSDSAQTRLGLPEVQLGLLPGSGGTQRLPRLIGLVPSLDLILTGKQVRPQKAQKLGLVDASVPHSILLDTARTFAVKSKRQQKTPTKEKLIAGIGLSRSVVFDQARKKTQHKARGNYPATDAILDVMEYGLKKGFKKGLEREAQEFGRLVMTPESRALRSIFFATTEMKKQFFADAAPRTVSRVGVLGGGLMGAGIAHVSLAKAKLPVRLKDVSHDGVLNALNYNYRLFEKQRKRRILSKPQVQAKMAQLRGATDFVGFRQLDVVIEAVFEDLSLKQAMVKEIEQYGARDTVFASNTSSLPIHQIAEGAERPENIVGLHYFSPAEKMPLVEVIPHAQTAPETVATVMDLARKQGKTPIVVKDSAGFYVNRILTPYMNEAAHLLMSEQEIEHIDNALLDFGFPVGPFTLLDEVGVDVGAKIIPVLVEALGPRFQSPELFDSLLNDGRKGRKSGKGFYLYKGKDKKVDKSVYSLLKLTPSKSIPAEDVAWRCVLPLLNEAVRCLDEGVIASARDGDIGAIFGIGFPPFSGGPFRMMDQFGLQPLIEKMRQFELLYGERFAPAQGLLDRAESGQTFYD